MENPVWRAAKAIVAKTPQPKAVVNEPALPAQSRMSACGSLKRGQRERSDMRDC
jgi:hypothetical protein